MTIRPYSEEITMIYDDVNDVVAAIAIFNC